MGMKIFATLKKVKINTNNTRGSNFIPVKLTTAILTKLPFGGLQHMISNIWHNLIY
jgi:hypothetical protein